jgi:hypothetical protein
VTLRLYKFLFCGKNVLNGTYTIFLVTFDYTILYSLPRGRLVFTFVRGAYKANYFEIFHFLTLFYFCFMAYRMSRYIPIKRPKPLEIYSTCQKMSCQNLSTMHVPLHSWIGRNSDGPT